MNWRPLAALLLVSLALGACGSPELATEANSPSTTATASPAKQQDKPIEAPSTVTVTIEPDATLDALLSARVPSCWDMPEQQLINGQALQTQTANGEPRIGHLVAPGTLAYTGATPFHVFADVAGRGSAQVVGVYMCGIPQSSGFLEAIILVDYASNTIGWLDTTSLTGGGNARTQNLEVIDGRVYVSWFTNEVIGQPNREGRSVLEWRAGQLAAGPA